MSLRLPVFPNWYPYNDMLLDGHLQVGRYHLKTRSYDWKYRGPVLLYNSGRVAWHCVDAYQYSSIDRPHRHIIGVATLVDVRELTEKESLQMECNFNNLTPKQLLKDPGLAEIFPLHMGYFFARVHRFDKPVPFSWPAGPVKPIFTTVNPRSALQRQLTAAGV